MLIDIKGKWDGVKEALKKTRDAVKSTAADMKKQFGGVGSFLSKAISPLGLGLSMTGIATFAGALVGKLDAIGKGADNLGIATDEFQKLQYAARRTNTSFEIVTAGFSKIRKFAGDFLSGKSEATDIFTRLGLSREAVAAANPQELFNMVNRGLASITDAKERDSVAAKLYGENFTKMNNFLRDYIDLGEEANRRGLIVSEDQIRAAEALDDAIENLKSAITTLVANSGFVEWLNNVADGIDAMATKADRLKQAGAQEHQESTVRRWSRNLLNGASVFSLDFNYNPLVSGKGLGDYFLPDQTTYSAPAATQTEIEANRKRKEEEKREKEKAETERFLLQQQAAAEAEAERQRKGTENVDKQLSDLDKRLRKQQMIIAGKQRELAITEELEKAEKAASDAGIELTPEQRAAITEKAGTLYDLANPAKTSAPEAAARFIDSYQPRQISDSLARIGGYNGAQRTEANNQLAYMRKTSNNVETINSNVNRLTAEVTNRKTSTLIAP